jgi:hypothetical protein
MVVHGHVTVRSTGVLDMMRAIVAMHVIVTVAAAAVTPAAAEDIFSIYSSTARKDCRIFDRFRIDGDDYYSGRACKGAAGYIVVVTEEDLRTHVTVGTTIKTALSQPAAAEGFGSFNSIGDTLEWRWVKGAAKPFAIIQRWFYADNENLDKSGRPKSVPVLIVTRLPPGPVCRVAQIDVKAGTDANTEARRVADAEARGFKCAHNAGDTI